MKSDRAQHASPPPVAAVPGLGSALSPLLHVVLVEPRIAGNIGAAVRLCAATGAALHICGRLVLGGDERAMRRAGLDYWSDARVHFHHDVHRCLALLGKTPWIVEVGGTGAPWNATFLPGDVIVLGPEDGSVPASLCADRERVLTLPTRSGARSLNLAQCASIVVFEALRQQQVTAVPAR